MLLLDFPLVPPPYNAQLQMSLAGSIALVEVILFGICLLNLKNIARGNYLLALLILLAVIAFMTGCVFNEHYYAEYLRDKRFGDEAMIKHDEAILHKLKEFFTISSWIGLSLSALILLLRMWWHQKFAADRYEK